MSAKRYTRQQVARERWLRGRLDYKLHAGQKLIRSIYRARSKQLFVGEIARQFGKSFMLVVEALETAFKTPKGRIKYGTAFQTDLLDFILPAFDIILADCPRDLRPVFKVQGSKFVLPHNGAEIKLVGLDRKPNGLRGNAIDLIILDEAGFMARLLYIYRSVIMPATTHRPHCRVLVFSTPPETPAHEFSDLAAKAELEGGYCRLTIYDNPMVNEPTIRRLMEESGGENSTTWKREYLALRVTDANLVIIAEWKDEYVQAVERDAYYGFYHRYVAMDLGVRDFTAGLFGYYDYLKGQLVIEDEYVVNGPELTTKTLEAELKLKELENWTDYESKPRESSATFLTEDEIANVDKRWKEAQPQVFKRVADNNNPLLLQDLSLLHGLYFTATDKGRLIEMVNRVKVLVRSGGLLVHPRCKYLIGSLKYGIWDKNRDKFAESKVYGHFDALAALIYLVLNLNRAINPIPYDFQTDRMNQIILPPKKETGTAASLKAAFGMKPKERA